MPEPRWIPLAAIHIIHDRQIARHGGTPGLRDQALLEAGLDRPRNRSAYEPEADLAALAAALTFGIAKAHAYVDGNKRTALVAALTFLRINGLYMRPDPQEGFAMMEGIADSSVSEQQFADWLRQNQTPYANRS